MFGDPVLNPKGWETEPLGCLTTKIGSGATPRGGGASYKDSGISLIRSLNVRDGRFSYRDLAFIDKTQAAKLSNVVVKSGDVLLNITGASVARVCVVPNDVLPARVNQHVAIIRPTTALCSEYLMQVLHSGTMKQKLLQIAESGATRQAITKTQIEELAVPVPPEAVQARFADVCACLRALTATQLDSASETNELFNSLSQRAFIGDL